MPAAATAANPPAETGPLAAAETEQEQARAEAAAITAKINALKRPGPGYDQAALAALEGEREAALKRLCHADLDVDEKKAAATAPISARALSKIRIMRRRVADLHPALMTRTAEFNHLRAHRTGLQNAIAALRDSREFRADERELKSQFVYGRDAQDGDFPPPARDGRKTPASAQNLAKLERNLTRTVAEIELAQAAQAEAQERWTNAKSTLESWEAAIRAQGPAAARALSELPQAGAFDDQNLKGPADISLSTPHALHQSQRSVGR